MKSKFIAYRSFEVHLNTIKQFYEAGYGTICVFPAHTLNSRGTPYCQYGPVWKWYDSYDFCEFDRQVRDVSRPMPGAELICLVDLNSPAWLEHMLQVGGDSFNNLGKTVHNPKWVEPTIKYMKDFLTYAESKYSSRIRAYVLACGATDEWYDYSSGTDDENRTAAWNRWRGERGLEIPADIPPESLRKHVTHEKFLRDPVKDREALLYWKFCNESISDAILFFAGAAREVIRREAELGVFSGYILEKAPVISSGNCLEYEKLLASPDLDFLISPGTYRDRQIGGGSGFLVPNGTARRFKKRLLHECDQRTHTYNSYLTPDITLEFQHWPDEASTASGIKRECSLALIKNASLWWFDMWGDFYKGEKVMNVLSRAREIWDEFGDITSSNLNQTALIVDPDSTYYFNEEKKEGKTNINDVHLGTRNLLNRLGAPFEVFSFNDIPEIRDFDDYRFVIFNSSVELTPEKMDALHRFVLKNNRVVLWLYAPGASDGETIDFFRCEKLTGFPFKSRGLQVKEMKGWTSAYLYAWSELKASMLKDLARRAGVNIYCEAEQPVYANSRLLAVHTAHGGSQKIVLPWPRRRVVELFTGRTAAEDASEFFYDFSVPDTALFELSE